MHTAVQARPAFDETSRMLLLHLIPANLTECESPRPPVPAMLSAGIMLPLAHASLRLPNLKARLSSAREEFRAVW